MTKLYRHRQFTRIRSWILATLIVFSAMPCYSVEVKLLIHQGNKPIYDDYVDGRNPLAITDYYQKGVNRDVMETVLLQQQLSLGGLEADIVIQPESSYLRILHLVATGQAALPAATVWEIDVEEAKDKFYWSEAMVARQEAIEGLYTSPTNKKALAVKSLEDLQQLTAVSSPHWKPDWRLLNALDLKALYAQTRWVNMVRMIHSGRADFIIAAFSPEADFSIPGEFAMIPIPNLRVNLDADRHWLVGKTYPNSDTIFAALKRGQEIMRKQGTIRRAYRESGVFDERVSDWELVNNWLDDKEHTSP